MKVRAEECPGGKKVVWSAREYSIEKRWFPRKGVTNILKEKYVGWEKVRDCYINFEIGWEGMGGMKGCLSPK